MKHHQTFLFFSPVTLKSLLVVVLLSQVLTLAISAVDFLHYDAYVMSQESEEPLPKECKNAFDYLEERTFLIVDIPIVAFFSDEILNTFHKEGVFFDAITMLDSPPPEVA